MNIDFKGLNLLALMPCPLKVPFEKLINDYLEKKKKEDVILNCKIEANVNNQYMYSSHSIYDQLIDKNCGDDLPDIILSTGLNSLFHTEFTEKFINKGIFKEFSELTAYQFDELKFRDPQKHYTMFAINPLIMVVDLNNKGELPVPEKWSDLTNEYYENKIILRGHKGMFCETVLLHIYKQMGLDGIKTLSKNVIDGLHPSQMAKLISGKKQNGAFIYVMPYFFAKTLLEKKNVQIVWPDEGALANPVSLLVKKDVNDEAFKLAELILGEEMGQVFANASFPVINKNVDNKLPENKKLKWIGWDFIREENLEERMKFINGFFQ